MPDNLKTNELHIGKLRDNDHLCGMMAAEGIPLSTPVMGGEYRKIA